MKKRICGLLLIIINTILLSGCWDAFEIKNHTVITLMGIDNKENKISLLGEFREITGESGKSESSTSDEGGKVSKVLIGEGESFTQAKEFIDRKAPGEIFLGAVDAIVFSDNFAKHGVEEYLNRIRGLSEFRKTLNVFTTSVKIENIFNSKELGIDNVGNKIKHITSHLEDERLVYNMSIAEASENMHYENTGYVIGDLDLSENKIEFDGYSIMKGNKKVGKIDAEKMKGVNLLLLKRAYEEYTLPFEQSTVALSVDVTTKGIEPEYNNGQISFKINMKLKCKLINFSDDFKLDENKIDKLETEISNAVKKDMERAIKESQQDYVCDYLYFYKYFKAKYPLEFDNMNWNDRYKAGKFNVNVKANVTPGNSQSFD